MVHKTATALLLGLALLTGCESKEAKPADTKAADAVKGAADTMKDAAKDAAKTTTDAAKDAAKTTADAAKGAADAAKDKAKDMTAGMKDSAIAEVQKMIDPIKKQAEDLYAKAAAKPELKGLVDTIKGEFTGLEKTLSDAKTSDKWSSLISDCKGKIDSVKKMVSDLASKVGK